MQEDFSRTSREQLSRHREQLYLIKKANLTHLSNSISHEEHHCFSSEMLCFPYQEALLDFEHALQLDTHYVPAWDGKAWALGILGQKTQALAAINKALELDSHYLEAQKRRERLSLL